MTRTLLLALVAAASEVSVPSSVLAADAPPASAASAAPRVRASHRVDVIAPGERVETVIERLRSGSAPPSAEQRPADQGMQPPPDGRRHEGAGRERMQGPRGTPGPAVVPGKNGPPSERPHR